MTAQYIKIDKNGNKFYFSDKEMTTVHREDGPAVEVINNHKLWYINGLLHREDGPAVEYEGGRKSYYLHNRLLSKIEYDRLMKPKVHLTLEQIALRFNIDVEQLVVVESE